MASPTPQFSGYGENPGPVPGGSVYDPPSHLKKIYPGNYVNQLSSYQFQPVQALPGRLYYDVVGYAVIPDDALQADNEFDIIVPSPDLRPCDKPRLDRGSPLVIPAGAKVYHMGLRVPNMRKQGHTGYNCGCDTYIVATDDDQLKLASAVNAATGITATSVSTEPDDIVADDSTFGCASTVQGALDSEVVENTADLELKLYVTNDTGTALGNNIYSTFQSGTLVVCEVCYWFDDIAPNLDNTIQPNTIESGQTR